MSAALSHCGLPVGIRRSRFIGLIRPALKARGLKTSAIRYLAEAFDKWTRDQDYAPGRICGFWHQVSGLAEELTCTERTVHSIERDLEDAQLVSRHPKANGRRDELRDCEGEKTLRKVFGINLGPIIEQAAELLAEAEVKRWLFTTPVLFDPVHVGNTKCNPRGFGDTPNPFGDVRDLDQLRRCCAGGIALHLEAFLSQP